MARQAVEHRVEGEHARGAAEPGSRRPGRPSRAGARRAPRAGPVRGGPRAPAATATAAGRRRRGRCGRSAPGRPRAAASRASASTRRVLPIPGSPRTERGHRRRGRGPRAAGRAARRARPAACWVHTGSLRHRGARSPYDRTRNGPRRSPGACSPCAGGRRRRRSCQGRGSLRKLAQEARSTASISRLIVTLSPTTTPPPSSGIEMSTPKSLRLIVVVAEKPARVPPKASGPKPSTCRASDDRPGHALDRELAVEEQVAVVVAHAGGERRSRSGGCRRRRSRPSGCGCRAARCWCRSRWRRWSRVTLDPVRFSAVVISPLNEPKRPRTLLTIMCRTLKETSECTGSMSQVPVV